MTTGPAADRCTQPLPAPPCPSPAAGQAADLGPGPDDGALGLGGISADLAVTLARRLGARTVVYLRDELASDRAPAHDSRYLVFRRAGACADGHHPAPVVMPGQVTRVLADSPVLAALNAGETVNVTYLDEFTADQFTAHLGDLATDLPLTGRALLAARIWGAGLNCGIVLLTRDRGLPSFSDEEVATSLEIIRWAAARYAGAIQLRREPLRMAGDRVLDASPPGMEVCHRYLPRSGPGQPGGDWIDVIPLPCASSALVIGDVMGHGADAALTMIKCQTTVRTLAAVGLPPDELLGKFDELAPFPGPDYLATCALVEYDPAGRSCRYASAGHVPPLLARPDGTCRVLEQPDGAPVGASAGRYETRTFPVGTGTIMTLCTDGLLELADRDPDVALDRLCDLVAGMTARPLGEICDRIFAQLRPEERRDDVTLLLARFLPP